MFGLTLANIFSGPDGRFSMDAVPAGTTIDLAKGKIEMLRRSGVGGLKSRQTVRYVRSDESRLWYLLA